MESSRTLVNTCTGARMCMEERHTASVYAGSVLYVSRMIGLQFNLDPLKFKEGCQIP